MPSSHSRSTCSLSAIPMTGTCLAHWRLVAISEGLCSPRQPTCSSAAPSGPRLEQSRGACQGHSVSSQDIHQREVNVSTHWQDPKG